MTLSTDEFRSLIKALTSADTEAQQAARDRLLEEDEDGVDALIGEFYSGVSEALGIILIGMVAEIGGPDALLLLRNVYHFEDNRKAWQEAAGRGLMLNIHNLDQTEAEDVRRSVDGGN